MAVSLISYAFRGDLKKLKRCINSGVDVDACESSGDSALYQAVVRNRRKCVKFLLENGADPNRVNKEGYTPVNAACLNCRLKCLKQLVKYGGLLERVSAAQSESAFESTQKTGQRKLIEMVNQLKKEASTDHIYSAVNHNRQGSLDQKSTTLPEHATVVLEISAVELKSPVIKHLDEMPHMTLQNAFWDSTPVTVKRFKGREDGEDLLVREASLLSWLRHPRITLLMAVCLHPGPENACLVLERFELASLNHLLHQTQTEMNLPARVNCLLDVAEGMAYLHKYSIVHGFINSYSVLIDNKFKAKVGSLEYAEENGLETYHSVCSMTDNWMSPEQLCRQCPANMASDVYSFGVLMWEILARKVPWSWLQRSTVKQALCEDKMTLPMLEIWPSYVQAIMDECLQNPRKRPSFSTLVQYLLAIRNRGQDLTSGVLDGAFPDWYEFQCGVVYRNMRRKRTGPTGVSVSESCRSSEIQVMLRRSSSGPHWNSRRRSTFIKGGLKDVLKVLQRLAQDSPREKDIERFGYDIAEQLAQLRSIHRSARKCERSSWAKEVVLTRTLEGDIERVKKEEENSKKNKKKGGKFNRRERRHSVFDEKGFENLQKISFKYKKKDWSKILHGMEKLKNSTEGFKRQVFDELSRCDSIQINNGNNVSELSSRYEEIDSEAVKGRERDNDRAGDPHTVNAKRRKKLSLVPTLPGTDALNIQITQEIQSKGTKSLRNTQLGQGKRRDDKGEFSAQEKERGITAEAAFGKEAGKNSLYQSKMPNMENEDPEDENSGISDSIVPGSSPHGSYAISDFLRETDSFRKEHLEMIALRNECNSTSSALVHGSSSKNRSGRRSNFSGSQRVPFATQVRHKSSTETVSTDKRQKRKGKIVTSNSSALVDGRSDSCSVRSQRQL